MVFITSAYCLAEKKREHLTSHPASQKRSIETIDSFTRLVFCLVKDTGQGLFKVGTKSTELFSPLKKKFLNKNFQTYCCEAN